MDVALSIDASLAERGWLFLPDRLDAALIDRLRSDLQQQFELQRPIQVRNGVGDGTAGTVHHLPAAGGSFLDLLEQGHGGELLTRFFGGPYILNTFGGVLNLPADVSYVGRVHRDLRTFSRGLPLMAQMLVMLDEFTQENGATYLLTGSHRLSDRPPDDEFFARAERAVGAAGSIVVFDSNLWHAAGVNRTAAPRRALTLAFTKPFIKPQFDYPRALGDERADQFSDELRQLLGYNARVPATLDEWYQPPARRMYRPGQG
jgi:hypothetical protein